MQFTYGGDNATLRAAVEFANNESTALHVWNGIEARRTQFYNTSLTTEEILARLRACTTTVRVEHWTPSILVAWQYDSTTAVTSNMRPFLIRYHTKFLHNSEAEMVNTLVHEFVHNVDYHWDGDQRSDYTHRGQKPGGGNQDSAPYWIGNLAQSVWEQAHQHEGVAKAGLIKSYAQEWEFECVTVEGDAEEAAVAASGA